MNLDLTEAQRLVQEKAREFAEREIEPRAAEIDRSARWPADVVARLGELGFLGIAVPTEHGGAGLDHVSQCLVLEELSAACAGSGAVAAAANALFCDPLAAFGTAARRSARSWRPPPPAALRVLRAEGARRPPAPWRRRQGDGSFVLDGAKGFVALGPEAEHAIVLAHDAEGRRRGSRRSSCAGARPASRSARATRGWASGAAGSCSLFFEGVRVPPRARARRGGPWPRGGDGRPRSAPASRWPPRRSAWRAPRSRRRRPTCGERRATPAASLPNLQAIEFMMADMAVDIDAARLLTLRAARLWDTGARHTAESAMAKVFASRGGDAGDAPGHADPRQRAPSRRGIGLERHYRDARVTEIDGGTSETQRALIAGLGVWPDGQRPGFTPDVAGILEA